MISHFIKVCDNFSLLLDLYCITNINLEITNQNVGTAGEQRGNKFHGFKKKGGGRNYNRK